MTDRLDLLSLSLRRFMGVAAYDLEPNGENTTVFGANETGKTTLGTAHCWLLLDSDSAGNANFDIKTLDENNRVAKPRDTHEVRGKFRLPGGRVVELAKVHHEVYTEKRGTGVETFDRNTTDHYVDGVERSKADYDAVVAEIAPKNVMRLLMDPTYFSAVMPRKDRRRLLVDVCGDSSDEDVIASDEALSELPGILDGRPLDDVRSITEARRSKLAGQRKKIPTKIGELRRLLSDEGESDSGGAPQEQLGRLREQRTAADLERASIESGGESAVKDKRVAEIDAEVIRVDAERERVRDERVAGMRKDRDALIERADAQERTVRSLGKDIEEARVGADRLDKHMDVLRAEYDEVDASELVSVAKGDCDACGHALPEHACLDCGHALPADEAEEARAAALAEFNQEKGTRLEELNQLGCEAKSDRDALLAGIPQNETARKSLDSVVVELRAKASALDESIESLKTAALPADVARNDLVAEKVSLEAAIAALGEDNGDALDEAKAKVGDLDAQIATVEQLVADRKAAQKTADRIDELQAEEKELAAEHERLSKHLHLMNLFVTTKVSMIEERINDRFELARFKLFHQQNNGALDDRVCEVLVGGVPYGTNLNTANRINVGLDIINTLADHFGIAVPVFVDGAESVDDIRPTVGQQIALVVSKADKQLRVEVAERSADIAA